MHPLRFRVARTLRPAGTAADPVAPARRHVLVAGGAAGLMALSGCITDKPVPINGQVVTDADYARDFRLNDPDGRERTLGEFKGKAVLMFFGFTQCPDICPTALARAAEVKRLLKGDGDRLQVIFVTVDPERDTPEVLKAYATTFDPSFLGLYADAQGTARVTREYKVFFMKVPTRTSYTIDHSTISYLYDPSGRLRVLVKHENTAEQAASDVRQVLRPA